MGSPFALADGKGGENCERKGDVTESISLLTRHGGCGIMKRDIFFSVKGVSP